MGTIEPGRPVAEEPERSAHQADIGAALGTVAMQDVGLERLDFSEHRPRRADIAWANLATHWNALHTQFKMRSQPFDVSVFEGTAGE